MKQGRKTSGGKYKKHRKRKSYERIGQRTNVKLGEKEKKKGKRVMGGNKKTHLLNVKFVNLVSSKGKNQRAEIKNVFQTPSNRFLARQNIITKGTIVETDKGKVKITNRPSQEGMVNGILVKE